MNSLPSFLRPENRSRRPIVVCVACWLGGVIALLVMAFGVSTASAQATAPKASSKEPRPKAKPGVVVKRDAKPDMPPSDAEATLKDEKWQVMYMGNARVGYTRSLIEPMERDGKSWRRSEQESVMAISRFGQTIRMRTVLKVDEALDGRIQRYEFELQAPPSPVTKAIGTVQGNKLQLETTVDGRLTKAEKDWDDSARGPGWLELSFRDQPIKPGEKRELKTFEPQFLKVDVVQCTAGQPTKTKLLDGVEVELLPVKVTHSVLPGVLTTDYMDSKGQSLKTTMSLLQTVSYTVSKEEALKTLTGAELDLGLNTLVKLSKPFEGAWDAKKAVFKVSSETADLTKSFPESAGQTVKHLDEQHVEVTVISHREPPATGDGSTVGEEYLESNSYLQLDDERVQQFAQEAVGEETDPWKQAVLMEKYVHGKIKAKNFSTLLGSASEVARTLAGDCTEHSVLLAAMARVKKIPSRAAVGLVYVPRLNAFGGHMWTEVYVRGSWIPLDATLGRGYVGPERLKFADTSFSGAGATPLSEFSALALILGDLSIELLSKE